jgi:hypothetical protein
MPEGEARGLRTLRERRLLLAVLEDAIRTYQRYAFANDRRGAAQWAHVEEWFASEDSDWTFSFVAICDILELDASYLRRGLRRFRESDEGARPTGEPLEGSDFPQVTRRLLPFTRSHVRRGARR